MFLNNSGKSPYLSTNEADNITSSVAAYVETEAGNWMTVSYNYRVEADEYVNFEFFNLIQYDCFADFGVYPVEQVGDDRLLQDAVKTLEAFVADETNFPGAADYLAGPIEDLKASMENPDLTVDDVNGMVSMILGSDGSALQEYLNTISADVSKYFNYFTFDDCAEKSANKGAADGWTESGGRWGVSAPWSNYSTRHIFAETVATAWVPVRSISRLSCPRVSISIWCRPLPISIIQLQRRPISLTGTTSAAA